MLKTKIKYKSIQLHIRGRSVILILDSLYSCSRFVYGKQNLTFSLRNFDRVLTLPNHPFYGNLYILHIIQYQEHLSKWDFYGCKKTLYPIEIHMGSNFSLQFHIIVHTWEKWGQWAKHGRTLEVVAKAKGHGRLLLTDLLLMTWPACSLIAPRTISPGVDNLNSELELLTSGIIEEN